MFSRIRAHFAHNNFFFYRNYNAIVVTLQKRKCNFTQPQKIEATAYEIACAIVSFWLTSRSSLIDVSKINTMRSNTHLYFGL